MEKIVRIERPYIEKKDNHKERLCANTIWNDGEKVEEILLFYEVDAEWGKYFVTEVSDAFVLAILENAMNGGYDVYFEQPLSEDLYYQLERYLIPTYSRKIKELERISLIGGISGEMISSENVVGTGFSAGVDSFHAILSNYSSKFTAHNVTHLLLCVNGAANTGMDETLSEHWFVEMIDKTKPMAEELHLKLIGVNSNIDMLSSKRTILKGGDAVVTSGFIHALRKLFGTYYWASTYTADVVEFSNYDGGYMEPLSLPWISVRGLQFYHAGSECSRLEKVKMIADNAVVQKGLSVCGNSYNCGRCFKCLRTMTELYSINKLDSFSKVFPVEDYKKNFIFRVAAELAIDHPPFTTDILKSMKENNNKVPVLAYLLKYLFYKPFYFIKAKLKNKKWLMKIYYYHHLDKKLTGIEHDNEYVKAKLEGRGK